MTIAPGRGRKPKPTKQKLAAGNPGKRKINKNEPNFEQISDAEAPGWLDDIGLAAWKTYAPMLCARGVLTAADLHNLEAFCAAYSRWRRGEEEVMRMGITVINDNGDVKKNPAATIVNEALRQMATFGSLLGIDPSSRTRIVVPDRSRRENPFIKLLQGGEK